MHCTVKTFGFSSWVLQDSLEQLYWISQRWHERTSRLLKVCTGKHIIWLKLIFFFNTKLGFLYMYQHICCCNFSPLHFFQPALFATSMVCPSATSAWNEQHTIVSLSPYSLWRNEELKKWSCTESFRKCLYWWYDHPWSAKKKF